jgi:hypothetical protein
LCVRSLSKVCRKHPLRRIKTLTAPKVLDVNQTDCDQLEQQSGGNRVLKNLTYL